MLLIALQTFSQVDLNQIKSKETLPMRVILPQAYDQTGYGINYMDIPIAVGAFDNYQISTTSGFAETDIIVNPNNPLNFVGTDNRITGFVGTPLIYYTTNGGVTWGTASVAGNQGDPVFAADSLGNLYLAVLNSGVLIYKSTNGGVSWFSLGLGVSNGNADKECIWADQTNGAYKNHVYFAYVNFSTGASVDFHRSVNNGTSWSFIGNMGTGAPNPGPDIAVGPEGRVYLAWYNGGGTGLRTSVDGGASFSASVNASVHATPGSINFGRNCLKVDIRVNGMPHIAVDMTNGSRRGWIYDCYATNPPGPDAADIYITRSTDLGVTWNAFSPVRVNNDATITDQWMSDVSVDNQGRVWVMWWDSRNDVANNLLTETWAAVSTDGALTFTNFRLTNQWNPNAVKISQGGGQAFYLGDYQGISGKTFTFPLSCGQNNNLQDYVAYLPDYGISFGYPALQINPGGNGSNRIIAPMWGPYSGTVTYSATVSPSPAPGTINFTYTPSNVKTYTGNQDSITLNYSVTANVPQQTYTISVTGAESGPRTHTRSFTLQVVTGIHPISGEIPNSFSLKQNYPNPFNPTTNINFGLPKQSVVTLKVYDMLGREVATLVNGESLNAGNYNYDFNASNIPSGIYFYKISTSDFSDVKKMILIK